MKMNTNTLICLNGDCPSLVGIAEASRRTGVIERHIRDLIKNGYVEPTKYSRRNYFSSNQIEKIKEIASLREESTSIRSLTQAYNLPISGKVILEKYNDEFDFYKIFSASYVRTIYVPELVDKIRNDYSIVGLISAPSIIGRQKNRAKIMKIINSTKPLKKVKGVRYYSSEQYGAMLTRYKSENFKKKPKRIKYPADPLVATDGYGNERKFESAKEAVDYLKSIGCKFAVRNAIYQAISNENRKTAYGLEWRYA